MNEKKQNPGSEAGISLIEVIAVGAVLSILALIGLPMVSCQIQKAKWSSVMTDLMKTRDLIELYEMETGQFPPDLQAAYGERRVPQTVIYCFDGNDPNAGHGNEECTFFDTGNPSGNNNHGGMPGVGFILRTVPGVANCVNINFAYTYCCGLEPKIVACDEQAPSIGHPKNDPPENCPGYTSGPGGGKGK